MGTSYSPKQRAAAALGGRNRRAILTVLVAGDDLAKPPRERRFLVYILRTEGAEGVIRSQVERWEVCGSASCQPLRDIQQLSALRVPRATPRLVEAEHESNLNAARLWIGDQHQHMQDYYPHLMPLVEVEQQDVLASAEMQHAIAAPIPR